MTIFVYEQDYFVRDDIFETLRSSFDTVVRHIPSLENMREVVVPADDSVVVLSLDQTVSNGQLEDIITRLSGIKLILIGGTAPDETILSRAVHFLQRPFKSEGLRDAVTIALSDPQ